MLTETLGTAIEHSSVKNYLSSLVKRLYSHGAVEKIRCQKAESWLLLLGMALAFGCSGHVPIIAAGGGQWPGSLLC